MSDPMSHSEVEDVLSSIRKLVSDTKPKSEPESDTRLTDKLVLTPSLRVTDALDNRSDAEMDENAELDPLQRVTALLDEAEETIREPKPAPLTLVPSEQVFEEDQPEEADATPDLTDHEGDADAPMEEGAEPEAFVVPEADEDASDEEAHETAQSDEAPDLVSTGWLDGDADENDVLIAQQEEQEADTDPAPEIDWKSVRHETLADFDPNRIGDVEQGSASDADTPVESLGDKVAALETLIQNRSDQWEPDDTGTDEYAGTEAPPMAWEDVTPLGHVMDLSNPRSEPEEEDAVAVEESFVAPEPKPEIEIASSAPEPSDEVLETSPNAAEPAGFDEDLLDEDALRDLVSEIVREELQGELGEKITRNVRKLVRREIHRILAAQDYE